MDSAASEVLQKAGVGSPGENPWAAAGLGMMLPAILGVGMGGIYAYYAMMKKKGLLEPKEKPMTEKQRSAITFAHIVLVLGDAIEKLTERSDALETLNKTLQESNASLAKSDSQARQEKSRVEIELAEARKEIARLREDISARVRASTEKKPKKSKAA